MMPEESGVEFIQKLRTSCLETTPVIMLTALNEVENRLEGLTAGADDYLSKPFEPKELVLRINNILKRTGNMINSSRISFSDYEFDFNKRVLIKASRLITISALSKTFLGSTSVLRINLSPLFFF